MDHIATAPTSLLSLTASAARRVHALIEEEGNDNLKLRVYITGGGCSGFQYGFMFDENLKPDDEVFEKELEEEDEEEGGKGGGSRLKKVKVVIDALSMMYLSGAEIDYKESLQGARFIVKNPHAQTTCSCGSSFALES